MRGAWLDPLSVRSASKLTAIKKKLEAPHSRAVSRRSKKIKRTLLLARASDGIPDEPGHAQAAPDRARASGCRRVVGAGAARRPRSRPACGTAAPSASPTAAPARGGCPTSPAAATGRAHEAPVRAARLRPSRMRYDVDEPPPRTCSTAAAARTPTPSTRGARVGVAERVGGAVERRPQQQLRAVEQHDGVGRADVERPRRVQLHAADAAAPTDTHAPGDTNGAGDTTRRCDAGEMEVIGYDVPLSASNRSVAPCPRRRAAHRTLYSGSPHPSAVLSGYGTSVEPHGGHTRA